MDSKLRHLVVGDLAFGCPSEWIRVLAQPSDLTELSYSSGNSFAFADILDAAIGHVLDDFSRCWLVALFGPVRHASIRVNERDASVLTQTRIAIEGLGLKFASNGRGEVLGVLDPAVKRGDVVSFVPKVRGSVEVLRLAVSDNAEQSKRRQRDTDHRS